MVPSTSRIERTVSIASACCALIVSTAVTRSSALDSFPSKVATLVSNLAARYFCHANRPHRTSTSTSSPYSIQRRTLLTRPDVAVPARTFDTFDICIAFSFCAYLANGDLLQHADRSGGPQPAAYPDDDARPL